MHSSRSTEKKRATPRDVLASIGAGIAGAGILFGSCSVAEKIEDRWYPRVETRRSELLDAASVSMECPREQLTVQAEGPKRARITGCERNQVFAWGQVLRGRPIQWNAIDPPCKFHVSGKVVDCH